ncbi:hypothetical protein C8A01DRAFT_39200 [Parachaetomium inaequale]|uniref:Uncharacterized protein n=1 Tax=Parachaetomium inaequale TaxID=2588326 RepID=A0AAN6PBE2_9PEZI|nr:hypothetical protein C8A01DRAFT_39200 [Parachaetomium inaequale]
MSHRSFMSKHREGELCHEEGERVRERAAIENTTPYKKREWSKSMLDFYADYKKLEPEVAKTRRAYYSYQNACVSFKRMTAEQHDHAAELANKWEQAAYRAASARAEFQEKYPDAYNHPNDPGHLKAIKGHMGGKENANTEVIKHRAAAEKIRTPPKYAPPRDFKRRSTRSLCSAAGIGDILDIGDD